MINNNLETNIEFFDNHDAIMKDCVNYLVSKRFTLSQIRELSNDLVEYFEQIMPVSTDTIVKRNTEA